MIISAIVAVAENGVIGKDGTIPWYVPSDFKFFKKKTLHHPIIMGRSCFESLKGPLPNRKNIVLTRRKNYHPEGTHIAHNLEQAFKKAEEEYPEEIFIIGGAEVYEQTMDKWDKLYYTEIHLTPEGDTFFKAPDWSQWEQVSNEFHAREEKDEADCTFKIYTRLSEPAR